MTFRLVAAISDIHGNLPALEAVLADLEAAAPDLVVCCGDVAAGYLEVETIDRLRALSIPARWVRGNADRGLVEEGSLDPERAAWLAGFEPSVEIDIVGLGRVLFCHGTPGSDEEILTEGSPEAAFTAALEGVDAGVVVGGHTHMHFVRPAAGRLFVNAGSVGRPYGEPGAHWLLLGPSLVARRTLYDFETARRRMAGTRWADDGYDLASPPGRAEVVPVFERRAGRDTSKP